MFVHILNHYDCPNTYKCLSADNCMNQLPFKINELAYNLEIAISYIANHFTVEQVTSYQAKHGHEFF